jgi:hypothetical protein
MARSFFDTMAIIGIAIIVGFALTVAFQEWYDYTEARRAQRRARRDHPSNSGPRYE